VAAEICALCEEARAALGLSGRIAEFQSA